MQVKELIEILQKLDQEKEIIKTCPQCSGEWHIAEIKEVAEGYEIE